MKEFLEIKDLKINARYIKLAELIGRYFDHRVLNIALDIAEPVRYGDKRSRRAAAVYPQRYRIVAPLEAYAHKRCRYREPAERGGHNSGGLMDAFDLRHHVEGVYRRSHDRGIMRYGPYYIHSY